MNNVIKNGREVVQYSVYEYADLVKQTPQNIRHKARKGKFDTEQTGVSAYRNCYEWIIEVDVERFVRYLGIKR